jgi:hypothetical protein
MRAQRLLQAAAMMSIGLACGDGSGPNPVTLADLVGSWDIGSWEYTLASDPAITVDWVASQDLTGSLTIESDGSFTVTPRLPGGFGTDDGTLTVAGDSLYWDGEDSEEWVRFALVRGILVLHWPEVELVDMDQNGQPEDVWLRVGLIRP